MTFTTSEPFPFCCSLIDHCLNLLIQITLSWVSLVLAKVRIKIIIKNNIKCLYWNLHGVSSKILGDKNNDPNFLKTISSYDVIGVSELHTKNYTSIPGFYLKNTQNFREKNTKVQKLVEELPGGGVLGRQATDMLRRHNSKGPCCNMTVMWFSIQNIPWSKANSEDQ